MGNDAGPSGVNGSAMGTVLGLIVFGCAPNIRRNIFPEQLPPAEDVKKLERRIKAEQKKLPKMAPKLGKHSK